MTTLRETYERGRNIVATTLFVAVACVAGVIGGFLAFGIKNGIIQ